MLCSGGFLMVALAAPLKPDPAGFVIDFGPAKWTADSEIVVHWEAADGTTFDQTVTVLDADSTPAFVRDLVAAEARENGWDVAADAKAGLAVRAYKAKGGPSPVTACKARVSDAATADQPTVKPARK
jgi:hypothetical protein